MVGRDRWVTLGAGLLIGTLGMATVTYAEQPLTLVYPLEGHETTADRIFLIGSAPAAGEVTINGQVIPRSRTGNFAPTFPLQLGDNTFTLRYGNQTITRKVTRQADQPVPPVGVAFAKDSLTPAVDIARLPGESLCFGAIAPPKATVTVTLNRQTIPLLPQPRITELPPNSAVLTAQNQPVALSGIQQYRGCTVLPAAAMLAPNAVTTAPIDLGKPEFQLSLNGQTVRQAALGSVSLLPTTNPLVIQVTAESGAARSGPSTDYSRLTPLPKGTRASVTGREGEWFRMDYGAWIRARDVEVVPNVALPQTLIRSVRSRPAGEWTEVVFPLQMPVPVSVQQGDRSFTLTLYNTTAQTDTILADTPPIRRMDWQQVAPGQVQYTFHLNTAQQWGYKLRYEGTSLILSLRNPPRIGGRGELSGTRILIDPGHGGPEDPGAVGPTGLPEKTVVLRVSQLLRDRLIARGATVIMTREADIDLLPNDRAAMINRMEPTIAVSVHYNALPDAGDAINTAGIGNFWYNTQSHSLAQFLHDYLVRELDRPSYGVFWNNLALTRPTVAPAVLLELGFMINPTEFEWIVNEREQERLADALADGITEWFQVNTSQF